MPNELDPHAQIDQQLGGACRMQASFAEFTTDNLFEDANFLNVRSPNLGDSSVAQSSERNKRKTSGLREECTTSGNKKQGKHATVVPMDVDEESLSREVRQAPKRKRAFQEYSAQDRDSLSFRGNSSDGSSYSQVPANKTSRREVFEIPATRSYLWAPAGPRTIFGPVAESLLPPFLPPPLPMQFELDIQALWNHEQSKSSARGLQDFTEACEFFQDERT